MTKQATTSKQAPKPATKRNEPTTTWRVSMGYREGTSDTLTVAHVEVQAPYGAVRRASKLGRAAVKAPSKDARFAGVLAVVRADALSLLAA